MGVGVICWRAGFGRCSSRRIATCWNCLRYIVLNPVRAGLVERAGDWKWSSYRATAGMAEVPGWLAVDWTLSQFARRRSTARRAFRRFVAEAKGSGKEIEALEKSGYFGDKEFRQRIQEMIDGKEISDEIPLRYRHARPAVDIAQVQTEVAREWNVPVAALARRRGGDDKRAAIYLAKKVTAMGGREIGAGLRRQTRPSQPYRSRNRRPSRISLSRAESTGSVSGLIHNTDLTLRSGSFITLEAKTGSSLKS